MTIDEGLLRKAVEWVEWQESLPEIAREWYQGDWVQSASAHAHGIAEESVCEFPDFTEASGELDQQRSRAMTDHIIRYCGSAYCVAGYIGQMLDVRYAENATVNDVHVSLFAANALGIYDGHSDQEAQRLLIFSGGNSAEDIRRYAEEYVGHAL